MCQKMDASRLARWVYRGVLEIPAGRPKKKMGRVSKERNVNLVEAKVMMHIRGKWRRFVRYDSEPNQGDEKLKERRKYYNMLILVVDITIFSLGQQSEKKFHISPH